MLKAVSAGLVQPNCAHLMASIPNGHPSYCPNKWVSSLLLKTVSVSDGSRMNAAVDRSTHVVRRRQKIVRQSNPTFELTCHECSFISFHIRPFFSGFSKHDQTGKDQLFERLRALEHTSCRLLT